MTHSFQWAIAARLTSARLAIEGLLKVELTRQSKNYLLLGLSGNKRVQPNKLLGRKKKAERQIWVLHSESKEPIRDW